jgi:hypothetical protein
MRGRYLSRPACIYCGRPLRRCRSGGHGAHGGNLFCGKTCGYQYAVDRVTAELREVPARAARAAATAELQRVVKAMRALTQAERTL